MLQITIICIIIRPNTYLLVFHGPIRRRRRISVLIIMQYFFVVFPGGDRPGPGARTSENCNTIL